jgi:uncharacterized membrane protein YfcA
MSTVQKKKPTIYITDFARRPLPYPMRAHEAVLYLIALGVAVFVGVQVGVLVNNTFFPEATIFRLLPILIAVLAFMMLTERLMRRFTPADVAERRRISSEATETK